MRARLKSSLLVVFELDERRFALPLAVVDRVIRAVEITLLPEASEGIRGVINVQGQVVPVVNLRHFCGMPDREPELDDRFILARASKRIVALPVDTAEVVECKTDTLISAESVLPGSYGLQGLVKDRKGLIFIYDLDELLSLKWKTPNLDDAIASLGGVA